MLYCRELLQCIVSFITLVTLSVTQCPHDAIHDMKLCIAASLPNFGLGPPADESPPEALRKGIDMAKESCRSESLMEAANCMQRILDQCKGITEQEQLLQRLFSKQKIMDTVRYFCNNFDIYEQHAKCIKQQHPHAEVCASDERENYSKMFSAGATIDVLILATCKFQDTATTCLAEEVNENCGNDAAVFLETIALGTRPPDCSEIKPKYTAKTEKKHNNSQHILPFNTLIVLLSVTCLINSLYSILL